MSEAKGTPKLSVVMPVYNERATIEKILERVQSVEIDKEIIVVDDGSSDGTRECLEALDQATAVHNPAVMEPRSERPAWPQDWANHWGFRKDDQYESYYNSGARGQI